jgi:eukaryotic-like serine/threonine-protein kinase
MTECLDDTQAAQLIAGELSAVEADTARAHIARCRECEQLMAELARLEVPSTETTEPRLDGELPRGATVGRFLVLGRIGSGGMGVVYAAYDPDLDRRIALKLLRGGADHARLLREAQAAAKLSHPNVVSVFDLGVFEGRVYLAMEHVDGVTLAEWLRGERAWQDIIEVFVQAGRGIAAAHDAGVIHRDFKPDNVLIGADGRARVVDFGLARAAEEVRAPSLPEGNPDETQPAAREVSARLTQTGMLLGTPRYMAPEQFAGGQITPATDQFGFCVALYQALYRTPPFSGDRVSDIATAVLAGDITPAIAGRGPLGLKRVVLRGLAVEPSRRHPSMVALLDQLERARTVRRRRVIAALAIGGGVVAVGVAVAVTLAARDRAPALCDAAGEQLADVWDPARADRVATAFRATHAPFADDAIGRVTGQLDRYGAEWTAMYADACKATHELGKQSAHVLDLRMTCLERRRASVRALTDVFVEADPGVVQRSVDAVAALDPIARCGDVEALSAVVPPPEDPVTRKRVDAVATAIAAADAQLRAGHFPRGLELARRAADDATAIGYAAIEGEARLKVAELEDAAGQLKDAEHSLDLARRAAALAKDDNLAARVWIKTLRVTGFSSGRLRDVEVLTQVAEGALLRAGRPPDLEGDYEHVLGSMAMTADDPKRARGHFEAALKLREQTPARDATRIATLLNNIGNTHTREGHHDLARSFLVRALDLRREILGPRHPEVAESFNNIGALEMMRNDLAAAEERMTTALAIWRTALGPEHPDVANAVANLGVILRRRGKLPQAIAHHEQAIAILRKTMGAQHPKVASALNHLADDYTAAKDHARASATYREAIPILIAAFGATHPRVGEIRGRLADALFALGDQKGAIAELATWLEATEKRVGADSADLVWPLAMLGGTLLDTGDRGRAIVLLERAVALAPKSTDRRASAQATFDLARALWERDPERARTLARAARDEFAKSPFGADEATKVDAWIKSHAKT